MIRRSIVLASLVLVPVAGLAAPAHATAGICAPPVHTPGWTIIVPGFIKIEIDDHDTTVCID